jgi:vancomycin permeability regulator SanA
MYNHPTVMGTKIAAAGGTSGATTLAYTGFSTAHYLVAAATLVFFGLALLRLVPRHES